MHPGTPRSEPPTPNAPYMIPVDLPPTPPTPMLSLPGRRTVPSQGMPAGGTQRTPNHPASYGIMTPPHSPQRGVMMHHVLQAAGPLSTQFDIRLPQDRIPLDMKTLAEQATQPPVSRMRLDVIGIFLIDIYSQHGTTLTVGNVLSQLAQGMSAQARGPELQRFPIDTQQRASQSSAVPAPGQAPYVTRVKLLGPRTLFAGLEVSKFAGGVLYCDVKLN